MFNNLIEIMYIQYNKKFKFYQNVYWLEPNLSKISNRISSYDKIVTLINIQLLTNVRYILKRLASYIHRKLNIIYHYNILQRILDIKYVFHTLTLKKKVFDL
jgi:hypothetical protein